MLSDMYREITDTRVNEPAAIARAAAKRVKARSPVGETGRAMIIAADHPARGSLNRSGLAGAAVELDDRFTRYDAAQVAAMGFDGGKMLVRIDYADDRTVPTLASSAQAINELADAGLVALIEPFISGRVDGAVQNDLSLKVPVVPEVSRVMAASTLPALLLGGEVAADPDAAFARWGEALRLPTVRGLVVGRSLLYPADDDVVAAVDTAVSLL